MVITSRAAWRGPTDHLPAMMAGVEITLSINSRELRTNRNLSRAAFVLGCFFTKSRSSGKGHLYKLTETFVPFAIHAYDTV